MSAEKQQIEQAIAHMESQRSVLGNAVVDAALAALKQQLATLQTIEASALAPAAALKGERKPVTILFADISGFTPLSERMDPESVRDLVNACFEHLVPVIEKYEGIVDKFIGDEIMALFGAPIAHENDPERALLTALEMRQALLTFNTMHLTDLGLHFGINTGMVIAGEVGTRQRQEYSVVGDAVNLASRLGEASARGEILVGPDTYRLTAPLFDFEALAPMQVKGKTSPVQIYRLVSTSASPGSLRGLPGLTSPLIGRQMEINALLKALGNLLAGRGSIISIIGEAGLGKSRLAMELQKKLPPQGITWIEGRCLSHHTASAYSLWLSILPELLDTSFTETPKIVQNALKERIQELCSDQYHLVYPYLSHLILPKQESCPEDPITEGETVKTNTLNAIKNVIACKARQQPLILVCDDLHWADPTSIDVLEKIFPLVQEIPLLLLCITRPEPNHASSRLPGYADHLCPDQYTCLHLHPLSNKESEVLLGNLLNLPELLQQIKERILGNAEGNPFYVEEMIRSLIESQVITFDHTTQNWRAAQSIAEIPIPGTLHGVLLARIDRLPSRARRTLQLASVIGRNFQKQVLEIIRREIGLTDQPGISDLADDLEILKIGGLIKSQTGAEPTYSFHHQLIQEAAYESLLKQERRQIHARVAEAMKLAFPDIWERYANLLAYHWEQAGESKRAIPYLKMAGEQASYQYAIAEARNYYERALVLAKETGLVLAEADVLDALSMISRQQGDFATAAIYIEKALPIYRTMSNRNRESGLLNELGNIYRQNGLYDRAISNTGLALEICKRTKNYRGQTAALTNLGLIHRDLGNLSLAKVYLEEAVEINLSMRMRWGQCTTLCQLGEIYRYLGQFSQAEGAYIRALELARELRYRSWEARILAGYSLLHHATGDNQTAYDLAQQALQIARQSLSRASRTVIMLALGNALLGLGEMEEAARIFRQTLESSRNIPGTIGLAGPLTGLAQVALQQNDLEQARSYQKELLVLAQAKALRGPDDIACVYWLCYQIQLAISDPQADQTLQHAQNYLQEQTNNIPDQTLRLSFIENIPVHRQILAAKFIQTGDFES